LRPCWCVVWLVIAPSPASFFPPKSAICINGGAIRYSLRLRGVIQEEEERCLSIGQHRIAPAKYWRQA
jgi:hypothetical protein